MPSVNETGLMTPRKTRGILELDAMENSTKCLPPLIACPDVAVEKRWPVCVTLAALVTLAGFS